MRFFKYLIVITFLIITKNAFAQCYPDAVVTFSQSLPVGSEQCGFYDGVWCTLIVQEGQIIGGQDGDGKLNWGKLNGESCIGEQEEEEPYECFDDVCPVSEQQACPSGYDKGYYNDQLSCVRQNDDDTLQCFTEQCYNPDNKFCPSGYVKGTFNNNPYCIRNINDDEECEVDCEEIPEITDEPEENAINRATTKIVNALNDFSSNIIDAISDLYAMLDQKLTDIANNQGNSSGSNNNGSGESETDDAEEWDGDTSEFDAELPTGQIGTGNEQFSESIFGGSSQCPADKELSINLGSNTYTYNFSFLSICDGLQVIGYFIMMLCYVFSAKLVVEA